MSLDIASRPQKPKHPYPGLRAFEPDEWPIFFGRDRMVDDVIDRLAQARVVFVHGASGSGKSSLVRAGVIPRLAREQRRQGESWRGALMRPSGGPLWNLARALAELEGKGEDLDRIEALARGCNAREATISGMAATLDGLGGARICLLVDQFEELFRYAKETSREEAETFVDLLTREAAREDGAAHVVVTMRSEFLGDCARYEGLAETINKTQYLVPRMDRDGLARAIERPARLYGGETALGLANRLIAQARGEDDELPLIQHALMLMWNDAAAKTKPGETIRVEATLLDEAGGLAQLLSGHADRVLEQASLEARGPDPMDREPPGSQKPSELRLKVAENIFRALTDINADAQAIRRPQKFADLVAVCGGTEEDARAIVDAFRAEGVSFLTPYAPEVLEGRTIVDISHEAVIRCWGRIKDEKDGWLKREFEDGRTWQFLLADAKEFERSPKHVLLAETLSARKKWLAGRPRNWTARYGDDWPAVERLFAASEEKAWRGKLKNLAIGAILAVAAASGFAAAGVISVSNDRLTAAYAELTKKKELLLNTLTVLVDKAFPEKEEQNLRRDNSALMEVLASGAAEGHAGSMYAYGVTCLDDTSLKIDKMTCITSLRHAIEKHDTKAMIKLARMRLNGEPPVAKDKNMAMRLLEDAAAAGNADAMVELADLLQSTSTDNMNIVEITEHRLKLVKLLQEAATLGNPGAKSRLAKLEEVVNVSRGNKEENSTQNKVVELYRQAADSGDVVGTYNIGLAYLNGRGNVEKNEQKAIEYLRKAADADYADALNSLGDMYKIGLGVKKDDIEAVKYYTRAAYKNNAASYNSLGEMYSAGRGGLKQSDAEALKNFRLAESLGDNNAMVHLGDIYRDGRGVARDFQEALRFYKEAAEAKEPSSDAMVALGVMYRSGRGVPKSDADALKLFRKAAEADNSNGQYQLALMYEQGLGGPKDLSEAMSLYLKARKAGHSGAAYRLGIMYENGLAVTKDDMKAREYYRTAALGGDADARKALDRMGEELVDDTGTRQTKAKKCSVIISKIEYFNKDVCFLFWSPESDFLAVSKHGVGFGGYRVQINKQGNGRARGYWNGPDGGENIDVDLGELKAVKACWENETAKLCFYK